jgi:hypothetical protein
MLDYLRRNLLNYDSIQIKAWGTRSRPKLTKINSGLEFSCSTVLGACNKKLNTCQLTNSQSVDEGIGSIHTESRINCLHGHHLSQE